jgi:DNA-binding MarR family transcriptional regulator
MDQDINTSRELLLKSIGDASRLNQVATDVFDERIGELLGINRTDGRCLDIIDRTGRLSAGQLATESGLTTGAVTAVIDRLEAAGYALRVRDPLDRRKIWVELTPALRGIVGQIYGFYGTVSPMLAGRFNNAELRAILTFLQMGTVINQHFAAEVREQSAGLAPNLAARAERARRVRQAMDANAGRLQAELDKVGR